MFFRQTIGTGVPGNRTGFRIQVPTGHPHSCNTCQYPVNENHTNYLINDLIKDIQHIRFINVFIYYRCEYVSPRFLPWGFLFLPVKRNCTACYHAIGRLLCNILATSIFPRHIKNSIINVLLTAKPGIRRNIAYDKSFKHKTDFIR